MRASREARQTRGPAASRRHPAVPGDSSAAVMSHTGSSGDSSPDLRRRSSRLPHAQEDTAEAETAGERLRQLNIGEDDDREHNRMIRSQYRELISTVQRKEAGGSAGAAAARSGLAAGGPPGLAAAPGRVGKRLGVGAILAIPVPRANDALGLDLDRNLTPKEAGNRES